MASSISVETSGSSLFTSSLCTGDPLRAKRARDERVIRRGFSDDLVAFTTRVVSFEIREVRIVEVGIVVGIGVHVEVAFTESPQWQGFGATPELTCGIQLANLGGVVGVCLTDIMV